MYLARAALKRRLSRTYLAGIGRGSPPFVTTTTKTVEKTTAMANENQEDQNYIVIVEPPGWSAHISVTDDRSSAVVWLCDRPCPSVGVWSSSMRIKS